MFELLEITWRDATTHDEWICLEHISELPTTEVTTVGYLVEETEFLYRVAAQLARQNGKVVYGRLIVLVPKLSVTRVMKLKYDL